MIGHSLLVCEHIQSSQARWVFWRKVESIWPLKTATSTASRSRYLETQSAPDKLAFWRDNFLGDKANDRRWAQCPPPKYCGNSRSRCFLTSFLTLRCFYLVLKVHAGFTVDSIFGSPLLYAFTPHQTKNLRDSTSFSLNVVWKTRSELIMS